MDLFKMLASSVVGLLGGYYMYRGKKTQSVKMILWGAALIIASYFLFSGGGNDDTTQNLLKNMTPSTSGQEP
jgi:hypothetical protein